MRLHGNSQNRSQRPLGACGWTAKGFALPLQDYPCAEGQRLQAKGVGPTGFSHWHSQCHAGGLFHEKNGQDAAE